MAPTTTLGGIDMKLYVGATLLFAAGAALSAQPALSQSAAGGAHGAGATASPQQMNRTGFPNLPSTVDPAAVAPAPGPVTKPADKQQQGATGAPGKADSDVYRANAFAIKKDAKAPAGGPKQEPSKAPLPAGYAYDANGRIGFLGGGDAGGKTGNGGALPTLSSKDASLSHYLADKDLGPVKAGTNAGR